MTSSRTFAITFADPEVDTQIGGMLCAELNDDARHGEVHYATLKTPKYGRGCFSVIVVMRSEEATVHTVRASVTTAARRCLDTVRILKTQLAGL